MTHALELVSFNLCPFVQRAAIVLEEHGRDYEITYIDLFDKPDWFLEISPLGKVPLLKVGDEAVLFESTVISAWLDETSDGAMLIAEDPLERAEQRMWIEFISSVMSAGWTLQAAKDEESVREKADDIRGRLEQLAAARRGDGPFWGGDEFTMVDASVAPILQRFTWADRLEPTLGIFEGLPTMAAWRDALLERPSVQRSVLDDIESINSGMLSSIGSWIARKVD